MLDPALQISDRISVLPVIHGRGDFAVEVRRVMLKHPFDCLAVPLPPSLKTDVETAIYHLPVPSLVVQHDVAKTTDSWSPEMEDDAASMARALSYVPIDPCQAVVAGLRIAMGEHMARAFIDLETADFEPQVAVLPDPYALKKVSLVRFNAAILPSLPRPGPGQWQDRIVTMARRLKELESRYSRILLISSVLDWPWIREAYHRPPSAQAAPEDEAVGETAIYRPTAPTLVFLFGELPFITGLYERARSELDDDENLSVDGIKELLITARDRYRKRLGNRGRKISPQTLSTCLKYIRNLTLVERRLTPDLYTVIVAAKQNAGDEFALSVAEVARDYPYADPLRDVPGGDAVEFNALDYDTVTLGIDQVRLPDEEVVQTVSRLPGPPVTWRSCQLKPRPDRRKQRDWQMRWNPLSQCSWPPEDQLIEDFRAHVTQRARAIMGTDLARTEKFTTSIKDGIDIRDTLRNWHTGEIYVKVMPPSQGRLDAAVMLFDSPADPRHYPWRVTWFAEHQNESTLSFFATDFRQEMVGPGIGAATYGGALFLFPPVMIPDIWRDRRLDFTETLEERVLAAACLHSECPHVALLSPLPPGAGWRRLARRYRKTWVHVPLAGFGQSTVERLRQVHVLNGRHVRSYAANFIRRA